MLNLIPLPGLTLHPLAGGLADPEIACDCCPAATFGLIFHDGPYKTLADVEYATAAWVERFGQ